MEAASEKLQLKYDIINDKYLEFIAELRSKICDKDSSSHGRCILPFEADANPPFVDIYLQQSGVDKGLARIRRFDLRLINLQDPSGNSLNVDEFQIYDDNSRLVDFGIEGFLLGLPTFVEAVNSLFDFCKNPKTKNADMGTSLLMKGDSKKELANLEDNSNVRMALPVLCLVLCEATKLDLLSSILGNAFKSGSEVSLSSWLLERIHDWEFFSKQLLTGNVHYTKADCDVYLPYLDNDWHCGRRLIGTSCQDVAQCLGILKAVSPDPELMEDEYFIGCKQVEVYSVRVYLNGGRSGSVYGNVKVHTNDGTYSIYKRDSNESESIESHGTLSLQDPNGFLTVENYVAVEVDLLDGGNNSQISKGKALWEDSLDIMFDSRISSLIAGENGYAIVYYSVFYQAITAEVEVTFLNKSDRPCDNVRVYGTLSGRYDDFAYATDSQKRYLKTMFYNKHVKKESLAPPCTLEVGTCNWLKVQEPFKLSRSRVAVPIGGYFILEAYLENFEGKPIVSGSISWFVTEFGESEGIIEGHPNDSHLLHAKVKWLKSKRDLQRESN